MSKRFLNKILFYGNYNEFYMDIIHPLYNTDEWMENDHTIPKIN